MARETVYDHGVAKVGSHAILLLVFAFVIAEMVKWIPMPYYLLAAAPFAFAFGFHYIPLQKFLQGFMSRHE